MFHTQPFFLVDACYCRPPVFGVLQAVAVDAHGKPVALNTVLSNARMTGGEAPRIFFKLRIGSWENREFRDEARFRFDPHFQDQTREVIAILDRTRRERTEIALAAGWTVVEEGWKGTVVQTGAARGTHRSAVPLNGDGSASNGFHSAAEIVELVGGELLLSGARATDRTSNGVDRLQIQTAAACEV